MRKGFAAVIAACLAPLGNEALTAENYPTRALTMIVPFPAGGATDTLGRYLGERMRPILGQSIIIENVAGAAGSIGVTRAVRAAADGYTLSIGTSTTHMLTGGLYALPFDLLSDLEPVIPIGSEPLLIVGRKSLKHCRLWNTGSSAFAEMTAEGLQATPSPVPASADTAPA